MSTDKYFISEANVYESSDGVVRMGEKKIENLKKGSIRRQD